jgi:hypothetical protein
LSEAIKPKPFSLLNHFTVPVVVSAMWLPSVLWNAMATGVALGQIIA